jgi:pyridoxal phosphate enzyme (YggS family)
MNILEKEKLANNLKIVEQRIKSACQEHQCNKNPRMIAVSKGQNLEKIRYLSSLGVKDFGENYLDEMTKKACALQADHQDIRWIFIGTLQSNKIKKIVQIADEIQTVASMKHAGLIQRYAEEFNKTPYPVYIAVNAADEKTKSGVCLAEVESLAQKITNSCPNLALQGIMAIPPKKLATLKEQPSAGHELYRELSCLAKSVGKGLLSLGMSADLEKAVAAGATTLRIGTALFGKRT